MIKVSFNNISFDNGIEVDHSGERAIVCVEGHSLKGKKGNDVICSAVSALAQTLLISIDKITGLHQNFRVEDGFLKTEIDISKVPEPEKKSLEIILDVFFIGMMEIERSHPGSLSIVFLE